MKKWILWISCLILFSCNLQPVKQQQQLVDNLFADYSSDELPGAAVMIVHDGKIVLKKSYGLAVVEDKVKVTAQSNFRLASVTKQFTAMVILQLVEQGKLSLNTTLTEIFPDFPAYGKSINIKDMLQHTSGMLDYEDLVSVELQTQVKDADVLAIMKSVESTYFPSGSKYKYSNSAYALLTQIIEKISAQPFRSYLQEMIFVPLKMNNTLAFEDGVNTVSNRAYGYTVDELGVTRTDQSRFSAVLGDGGIYSNLNDLFLWDQALYEQRILSKELLTMAFTNQKNNQGEYIDYGFGWRLEKYKGMDIKYHTGSSKGFRNIYYRIPERNFSVVILTNRNGNSQFTTLESVHQLIDIFLK